MRVEINSQGFRLTPGIERHALRRLRPLTSAQWQALRIRLHLSDENGPRGGVDKRCRLSVHLPGRAPLVVSDTCSDLYHAIDQVARRARQSLARRSERARSPIRRPGLSALTGHDDTLPTTDA